MKSGIVIFFTFLFVIVGSFVNAQNIFSGFEHLFTPVRKYVVYQTISTIEIDGKMIEASWENAAWTDVFLDIEGEKMPKPLHQTRVKMLWDEENLYILAELEEPHVWAYYEKHDMIVFNENDFEIFIDPNGDSQNYFEIEVNAQNTIFDLFMPQPYRDGGIPFIAWNTPGLKSAIHVDGTLNNPADTDKKWTVEMAIPFSAFQLGTGSQTPADNQIWRINFSRVQWQTEIKDEVYHRKTDPANGRILPEYNWVWSPQGIINMHYPERWGMLQFSKNRVDGEKVDFQNSTLSELQQYLWLVYYKQKSYQAENGKYATQLSGISMTETFNSGSSGTLNFELIATPYQFMLFLTTENGTKMSVNENGIIRKLK
jgi:hypothetical protein